MNVPAKKINKSQLIFNAFKILGINSPALAVAEYVKKEYQVDVKVNLINVQRHTIKNKTPELIHNLLEIKQLADKVGGIQKLKKLIEKLEELLS